MSSSDLYSQYQDINRKAADFNNAAAVLGWDQEVFMPPKGFLHRGRQLATLASAAHELATSETYGNILQELNAAKDLNAAQQRNVQLSVEDYEKNKKLSADFVERLTQQTSDSYSAWMEARKQNDYSIYAPQLEKMIVLKKQQAELFGYENHPYNALLDEYEKGATVASLDPVFEMVRNHLSPLYNQIVAQEPVDDSVFNQHFSKGAQFDFSLKVLQQMGYDFEAGRQDYSEHPFSTSFSPADVRITTRVDEKNLASLLWSSIHEGGHALYEQGLPEEQYGLPLGAAVSLAIHESQSRLWENCVGRGLPFWKYYFPKLQEIFPEQLKMVNANQFYRAANKVAPSLIRTEADEISYHFHVMIRYEIEKALFGGEIKAADLATVWNEMYQKYLGISSPDDKQGILQDVHWCHGSFGYFPTYSLGSFYAAQFYEQAVKELTGLEAEIEAGNYADLLKWLRENVHIYGRFYDSEALCKRITGKGLDFSSFLNYARQKYSDIYSVGVKDHVV